MKQLSRKELAEIIELNAEGRENIKASDMIEYIDSIYDELKPGHTMIVSSFQHYLFVPDEVIDEYWFESGNLQVFELYDFDCFAVFEKDYAGGDKPLTFFETKEEALKAFNERKEELESLLSEQE